MAGKASVRVRTLAALAGAFVTGGIVLAASPAEAVGTAPNPDISAIAVTNSGDTVAFTSTTAATVTGTVTVQDQSSDSSGLEEVDVTLSSPDGSAQQSGTADLSHTVAANTYAWTVTIPSFSPRGVWTISDVTALDNDFDYTEACDGCDSPVAALGGSPHAVSVTGPVDITPPVLTQITGPSSYAAPNTGGQVTFSGTATDNGATNDGSGVNDVSVELTSPTGQQAFGDLPVTSPPATSASFSGSVDLPDDPAPGPWRVAVTLTDATGNEVTYDYADIVKLAGTNTSSVSVTNASYDGTPPQLTGLTLTPNPVDTTGGTTPVTLHVTATATDPSGVSQVRFGFEDNLFDLTDLTRTSGSAAAGTWTGTVTIPVYATTASVTKNLYVELTDVYQNQSDYDRAALNAAGLTSQLPMTQKRDTVAPTLNSIGAVPTVDTTTSSKTANIPLSITDLDGAGHSGSGVSAGGFISGTGPTGNFFFGSVDPTPVSGTSTNGTFKAPVFFSQMSPQGTYTITNIDLFDAAGNSVDLSGSQIPTANHTFQVQGSTDVAPPALNSLSFSPTNPDVSTGPVSETVTLGASDASGFSDGEITLDGPHNTEFNSFIDGTPTTGSATHGTFTGTFTIPRWAPAGTYTVSDLFMSDTVNNTVDYNSTNPLPTGASIASSLNVADTNPDFTAPSVTALTWTPTGSLDTSTGQVRDTLDFTLTDDVSGVSSAQIELRAPDNGVTEYPLTQVSGSGTNGHWQAVVPFSAHSLTGTWTVSDLDVTDNAGNENDITTVPNKTISVTHNVANTPSAPTNLRGQAGVSSVDLQWEAPANDGGSPITGYKVTINPAGGGASTTQTFTTASNSETVTGLTNGTTYSFQVQAINGVGAGDLSSNSARLTPEATVPDAPFNVAGSPGNGKATVSWNAPSFDGGSPITGYDIVTSSNASGAAVPAVMHVAATATSVDVTGLTNNEPYTFVVYADNAIGQSTASDPSDVVTPVPAPTAPGTPTGLTATAGNASAILNWTPPADGGQPITSYDVLINGTGTPVHFAATDTTGSHTITGLTNGTSYTFEIRANNSVGNGTYTAASNAVTPATAPGAPTIGTASLANADGSATVTWTAPTSNGGSAITGYVVKATPTSGPVITTPFNSTATTQTISGLTDGTSYTFQVAATNVMGTGNYSDASNAVTPAAPAAPGAPAAPTAVAGNGQATVSWSAPTNHGTQPITGYVVKTLPGGATQSFNSTATSQTITGLTNGTTYTFEVAAVNVVGTGTYSGPSNAVTPAVPTAPATPAKPTATAGDTSARVSWTAPADGGSPITGYDVQVLSGGTPMTTQHFDAGATSGTVTGLVNGTSYTFEVRAVNAIGNGTYSDQSDPVTPIQATQLTVGGPVTIAYGKTATVGATLTDPNTHTPIPGVAVNVFSRQGSSGGWTPAGTATTNSQGVALSPQTPTVNSQYAFQLLSSESRAGANSGIEGVTVDQVVSAAAKPTKLKHNHSAKIFGTVTPNEKGQTVSLQVFAHHKWVALPGSATIKQQKLPNHKKTVGYVLSVKEKKKGTYQFRVVRAATATNGAGVSKTVKVKFT